VLAGSDRYTVDHNTVIIQALCRTVLTSVDHLPRPT
jgi:hypothetical protein